MRAWLVAVSLVASVGCGDDTAQPDGAADLSSSVDAAEEPDLSEGADLSHPIGSEDPDGSPVVDVGVVTVSDGGQGICVPAGMACTPGFKCCPTGCVDTMGTGVCP
jgi:hypothetical protein